MATVGTSHPSATVSAQVNDTGTLTCEFGKYFPDGQTQRDFRCLTTGQFNDTNATCITMCILPNIGNGSFTNCSAGVVVLPGTVCPVVCFPGFDILTLTGPTEVLCDSFGTATPVADCTAICTLPDLQFGSYDNCTSTQVVPVGTVCPMACAPGYHIMSLNGATSHPLTCLGTETIDLLENCTASPAFCSMISAGTTKGNITIQAVIDEAFTLECSTGKYFEDG
eukprot:771810_1